MVQIENILKDSENQSFFVGREFTNYNNLYEYSLYIVLSKLQIYVVSESSDLKTYSLDIVISKCMVFPFEIPSSKYATFPQLHNLNNF